MKIYTLNRNNEQMLSATMSLLSLEHLDDLKRMTSIVMPDLLLIDEDEASEMLTYLDQMPDQNQRRICDVIVLVRDSSLTTIREWTSLGAKTAWLQSEWEELLIETYGTEPSEQGADRPRQYNNKTPVVVAVATSFAGNGGTHTALMIAKYLESNYGGRVAVVEAQCAEEPIEAFTVIQYSRTGNMPMVDEGPIMFKCENLHMVCSGLDPALLEQLTRRGSYDFIVLDMGVLSAHPNPTLFFTADLQVLLSSGVNWRIPITVDVLTKLSRYDQKDVRIVVPMVSPKERSFAAGVFPHRFVTTLSAYPNVFQLNEQISNELHTILSPILPKSKRRGLNLLGL